MEADTVTAESALVGVRSPATWQRLVTVGAACRDCGGPASSVVPTLVL